MTSTYLRAAERIVNEDDEWACTAILYFGVYEVPFARIFCPFKTLQGRIWYGLVTTPENQLARSLALLFMHEFEKDGVIEEIGGSPRGI